MLAFAVSSSLVIQASFFYCSQEAILEINRLEREQTDFSRSCLFCREVCRGNRKVLFDHMFEAHAFHIGQADNIVFVEELMNHIESQLLE